MGGQQAIEDGGKNGGQIPLYPTLGRMVGFFGTLAFVFSWFVIPVLEKTFATFPVSLPWISRLIFSLSHAAAPMAVVSICIAMALMARKGSDPGPMVEKEKLTAAFMVVLGFSVMAIAFGIFIPIWDLAAVAIPPR